eukprot:CAMPEP_0177654712 /NCGR_PEP_ID=MMETSP0447-20121125/14498_1 /TAXON_ID=0 /ORGANISM="Stygamoeba regulata, Strain BSH-02190019" /LENGTH=296 /DNA_ID=CAMNT_0019158419 /DNA_START=53 /DNA_END=944 /DNA_ORIENTATION=+
MTDVVDSRSHGKLQDKFGVETLPKVSEYKKRHSFDSEKAQKFLGVSNTKAMSRLGIEDEEHFKEAELAELKSRLEALPVDADISTKRLHANKKLYDKACRILGLNPSEGKLMMQLGVADFAETASPFGAASPLVISDDEPEPDDALVAVPPRDAHGTKALRQLGYNPSQVKLMQQLGLDSAALQSVQVKVSRAVMETLEEQAPSSLGRLRRAEVAKACKLLGYNLSTEKLKMHFGFSDEDLREASAEGRPLILEPPMPAEPVNDKVGRLLGIQQTAAWDGPQAAESTGGAAALLVM